MILIWCDQPSMKSRWLMGYLGDGFQWLFNVIGHRSERDDGHCFSPFQYIYTYIYIHPHFSPRSLFLWFRARGTDYRGQFDSRLPRLIRFETEMLNSSVCPLDLNNHEGRKETRKLPEGKSSQMAPIEISLTISACNSKRFLSGLPTPFLFFISFSLSLCISFHLCFSPFPCPQRWLWKPGQVKLLLVTLTAGSLVGRR